jgi:hypothetical protein
MKKFIDGFKQGIVDGGGQRGHERGAYSVSAMHGRLGDGDVLLNHGVVVWHVKNPLQGRALGVACH